MNEEVEPLQYQWSDIEQFMRDELFLAAAHSYALGLIPLGIAYRFAFDDRTRFRFLNERGLGLYQALQDGAERIMRDEESVPATLRDRFPAIYTVQALRLPQVDTHSIVYAATILGPNGPEPLRGSHPMFHTPAVRAATARWNAVQNLMFHELAEPDARREMLGIHGRNWRRTDYGLLLQNADLLARMDVQNKGKYLKIPTATDAVDGSLRELHAIAHQDLLLRLGKDMQSGQVIVGKGFRKLFPDIYSDVGYREEDLQVLMEDERFLAAAHAYSKDYFPLGMVRQRAYGNPPWFNPPPLSPLGAVQAVHEIAARISKDPSLVPAGLAEKHPDIYRPVAGPLENDQAYNMLFSTLNRPELTKHCLRLYRQSWDDEDYRQIIRNERMVVCIDAYTRNVRSNRETLKLMVGEEQETFNDIDPLVMARLLLRIGNEIVSGVIKLSDQTRAKYPMIYERDQEVVSTN